MKKMRNNEKAITLIALVVTIIILLILAGVTIGVAMNGTGLFEKAKLATDKYNNEVDKENYELGQTMNNIENYSSFARAGENDISFSTDEKIVGQWFGQTLYQKSFNLTTPSSSGSNTIIYTLPSGTLVHSFEGFFAYDNENPSYQGRSANYYCDSSDYSGLYIGGSGTSVVMNVCGFNTNKPLVLTIWYTKAE